MMGSEMSSGGTEEVLDGAGLVSLSLPLFFFSVSSLVKESGVQASAPETRYSWAVTSPADPS